nr:hypothetical protein [Tanacetum cinerariifolium]
GYVDESDPEEDPEEYDEDGTDDGPVGYPMDGGDDGDDDDIDSSGCMALSALPSPPLPPSSYPPPPIDRRDGIPESEQPPRKRLCLSTLGSSYEVGESSTRGRGAEMRHRGIREVGHGIRDTWIGPVEAIPEMVPTTLEKRMVRLIIPWTKEMMEMMMTAIHLDITLTMRMRTRKTRRKRRMMST